MKNILDRIRAELPATQSQIRKATGLAQSTISRYLTLLQDDNAAHIGAWAAGSRGFIMSAVYHAGPGEAVPCPAAIGEAGPARRQSMRGRPRNVRKLSPSFDQPLRCELTAAFFGRPARRDATLAP